MFGKKIKSLLVFFCAALLFWQCARDPHIKNFKINYSEGKAVSVAFELPDDKTGLKCVVQGQETAIFGDLEQQGHRFLFTPIVPFTPGNRYEIRKHGTLLSVFELPASTSAEASIKAIYPSGDTVPENLLKVYLQFNQPMEQLGNAFDFISVIDRQTGKETEVFLKLESELWNKEHDRLTLWLDPGRIKTNLIPNKEKGLPLIEGHRYTLKISKHWKTDRAIPLDREYTKNFTVLPRDDSKPNPLNWEVLAPQQNTIAPFTLSFNEAMDAVLALETIRVIQQDGEYLKGRFELLDKDTKLRFHPAKTWHKGKYNIIIDPKLEDLAGNNLNRLFDTDLKSSSTSEAHQDEYILEFTVN